MHKYDIQTFFNSENTLQNVNNTTINPAYLLLYPKALLKFSQLVLLHILILIVWNHQTFIKSGHFIDILDIHAPSKHPTRHVHVKLPSVLLYLPPFWHGVVVIHSSVSISHTSHGASIKHSDVSKLYDKIISVHTCKKHHKAWLTSGARGAAIVLWCHSFFGFHCLLYTFVKHFFMAKEGLVSNPDPSKEKKGVWWI